MSSYWIADREQRVLGPIGIDVLRDLISAGRVTDIASVSRDGKAWLPVDRVAEVRSLVSGGAASPSDAADAQKVAKVREFLAKVRAQPPHKNFDVPQGANLNAHRAAFFALVKRFYPDRLPAGTSEALRAACEDVFLFLAGQMVEVEQKLNGTQPAVPKASVPPRAPAAAAVPAQPSRASHTYGPEEFVGVSPGVDNRIDVKVRVTTANATIFTQHPLVNFATQALFIPGQQSVPLGSQVDLHMNFADAGREIEARGKVVLENHGADPRQPTGFGVRLLVLAPKDREFIQKFIAQAKSARR